MRPLYLLLLLAGCAATNGNDTATNPLAVDNDGDGYTEFEGDCDDSDPTDMLDADGDGYATCNGDCDDLDPSVNPGATDTIFDRNCDGVLGEESCAEWAPTILSVTIENGGFQEYFGELWPTVLIQVDARDNDGDLNFATLEMWWDREVDGSVDTSRQALKKIFTSDSEPCKKVYGSYEHHLMVGMGLDYHTTYDFAVRVGDYSGRLSQVEVESMTTPKEDGSD